MTAVDHSSRPETDDATGRRIYGALIGLAALAVLLQAVWAGLFVQEGEDYKDNWVQVHARGADVALALGVLAFVAVVWKLRRRKDLLIGTGLFVVLIAVEAYLGGQIGDTPGLTVVHFPLGMALMALSVWLPLRARRG